jgi:hypothetical protein
MDGLELTDKLVGANHETLFLRGSEFFRVVLQFSCTVSLYVRVDVVGESLSVRQNERALLVLQNAPDLRGLFLRYRHVK